MSSRLASAVAFSVALLSGAAGCAGGDRFVQYRVPAAVSVQPLPDGAAHVRFERHVPVREFNIKLGTGLGDGFREAFATVVPCDDPLVCHTELNGIPIGTFNMQIIQFPSESFQFQPLLNVAAVVSGSGVEITAATALTSASGSTIATGVEFTDAGGGRSCRIRWGDSTQDPPPIDPCTSAGLAGAAHAYADGVYLLNVDIVEHQNAGVVTRVQLPVCVGPDHIERCAPP